MAHHGERSTALAPSLLSPSPLAIGSTSAGWPAGSGQPSHRRTNALPARQAEGLQRCSRRKKIRPENKLLRAWATALAAAPRRPTPSQRPETFVLIWPGPRRWQRYYNASSLAVPRLQYKAGRRVSASRSMPCDLSSLPACISSAAQAVRTPPQGSTPNRRQPPASRHALQPPLASTPTAPLHPEPRCPARLPSPPPLCSATRRAPVRT